MKNKQTELPSSDLNMTDDNLEGTSRVNHPDYYNTNCPKMYIKCPVCGKTFDVDIECIEVIRNMPTWKGNIIKYLWRAGLKKEASLSDCQKEIEDLEKGIFYLQDIISYLKKKKDNEELSNS